MFVSPQILGINWTALIFVNIVWWDTLQGIMTFYIANRLTPRDWRYPLLSQRGRKISMFIMIFSLILLRIFSKNKPSLSLIGIFTILGLILFSGVLFMSVLRKRKKYFNQPVFRRDKLMDILSIFTITLFLFSFMFITSDHGMLSIHPVNLAAVKVIIVWTTLLAVIIWTYRLFSKRELSI